LQSIDQAGAVVTSISYNSIRKSKMARSKQLTVRPNEIVATAREGNCEFDISVSNQSTREQILNDAREIVNGHPRVEIVEEETSRQRVSPVFPISIVILFSAHIVTIFLIMGLIPLYIILAVKSDRFDQSTRIIWVLLMCMLGMFAMPVYWYLYIWRAAPPRT
jgi:hypothetical protein